MIPVRHTVSSRWRCGSVEAFQPGEDPVALGGASFTYRQALVVATRYPDLATERLDLVASDVATHLIVPHHDMGHFV